MTIRSYNTPHNHSNQSIVRTTVHSHRLDFAIKKYDGFTKAKKIAPPHLQKAISKIFSCPEPYLIEAEALTAQTLKFFKHPQSFTDDIMERLPDPKHVHDIDILLQKRDFKKIADDIHNIKKKGTAALATYLFALLAAPTLKKNKDMDCKISFLIHVYALSPKKQKIMTTESLPSYNILLARTKSLVKSMLVYPKDFTLPETEKHKIHEKSWPIDSEQKYLYIQDLAGTIFISPEDSDIKAVPVKHTDVSEYKPVSMAGEIDYAPQQIMSQRHIKYINNRSGHHHPNVKSFLNFCRQLYKQHIIQPMTKIHTISRHYDAAGNKNTEEQEDYAYKMLQSSLPDV